jgi:hypothetical protein
MDMIQKINFLQDIVNNEERESHPYPFLTVETEIHKGMPEIIESVKQEKILKVENIELRKYKKVWKRLKRDNKELVLFDDMEKLEKKYFIKRME